MADTINFGLTNQDAFGQGVDQMNALLKNFAMKRAGTDLASGDQQGAVNELYKSGNVDAGNAVQDRLLSLSMEQRKQKTQMVSDVADELDNISRTHGPDAVVPAFDHLTPFFKAHGATDEDLGQMRNALVSDPQGFISAMSTHTAEHLKAYNLPEGETHVDNGVMTTAPKVVTQSPGQTVLQTGGSVTPAPGSPQPSQTPAPGGPAPAPAAPGQGAFPDALDKASIQKVESNNNPNAVSPKGAQGLMQVEPSTQVDPGYGVRPAHITPDMTPEQIQAEKQRVGNDYIEAMQQKYNNPTLALMAYNWGPGNVDQWIASGGDVAKVPQETREYLGKVAMAHAQLQAQQQAPQQASQPDEQPSGVKVLAQGGQVWRPLTPDEQKQYPNADQINSATGEIRNAPAGASPAAQLTPRAIHAGAIQLLTTGAMPQMGMGSMIARAAIMNDASQTLYSMGRDPRDIAGYTADYKASSSALSALMKQRALIGSYEGTVQQSINLVQQHAGALPDTGWRDLNKLAVWVKNQRTDPAMSSLNAAILGVVNEYAKVITNATGGGVTSDAARNRADTLLSSSDSLKSLMANIDVLRKEMKYRVDSLDDNIKTTGAHLHSLLPPDPTTAKVRTYNPKTGNLE